MVDGDLRSFKHVRIASLNLCDFYRGSIRGFGLFRSFGHVLIIVAPFDGGDLRGFKRVCIASLGPIDFRHGFGCSEVLDTC